MKRALLPFFLLAAVTGFAQPKVIEQAIITTRAIINIPEDASNMNEGQGFMGMSNGDETKITTWFKNDMMKILNDGSMGKITVIMDMKNKKTTTLMEMMGKKSGFYSTEDDEKEMKRRMDSMSKRKTETPTIDIEYLNDTKKISGYTCKKALIKTTRSLGRTDSMYVWYNPEMKMSDNYVFRSGGMGMGGGGGATGMGGFNKLAGFPMQYEVKMRRGTSMTIEVTKIDTEKPIDIKEFDIPKGYEIQSVKDMQKNGGGFPFRMGG